MYIDAGCNVYFDFSLRMNERKITSHSGHAILVAQITRVTHHQPSPFGFTGVGSADLAVPDHRQVGALVARTTQRSVRG